MPMVFTWAPWRFISTVHLANGRWSLPIRSIYPGHAYKTIDLSVARWVTCDDEKILKEFKKKNESRLTLDSEGWLTFLTTSEYQHINISRMMVGREDDGDKNIIFLKTDTLVPPDVVKEIEDLDLFVSMTTFEL